jgi:hypothetical protein
MLADAGVEIVEQHWLSEVVMDGKRIKALKFENGNTAEGLMYIDATYEGDLFAKAKVSYHVGRESNATYGETLNGVQFRDKHNFLFRWTRTRSPATPRVVYSGASRRRTPASRARGIGRCKRTTSASF